MIGTGPEAGQALVEHELISVVSFTGSTAVGVRIGALAATNNKKVSLEMGGKNPCIVYPSVALPEVVPQIVRY